MKNSLTILLLLLLSTIITSSQDITFYDNKGKITNAKKASYFETVIKLSDNQYCSIKQKMNNDTISLITYSSISPSTRDGITKIFYESGMPHYIKNYKNNKLDGETVRYNEDGSIKSKIFLIQDSVLSEKSLDNNGKEIAYVSDEILPKYGNKSMDHFRYFLYNINYPQLASDYKISEKCEVEFSVNENGNVQDIEVQSIIVPFKDEIVKTIQKTDGKWVPGKRYGEVCKIKLTMTINFSSNK